MYDADDAVQTNHTPCVGWKSITYPVRLVMNCTGSAAVTDYDYAVMNF